ncbi:MAG: hypothetical protein ACRD0D_12300 [Acidimicrobiales bacterium]
MVFLAGITEGVHRGGLPQPAVSPGHVGRLEAVRMVPDHHLARAVTVERLDSAFLARFRTARPAPCYLMEDVAVTWAAAPARRYARLPVE